jgi:neutral amino acid transport system permease protein
MSTELNSTPDAEAAETTATEEEILTPGPKTVPLWAMIAIIVAAAVLLYVIAAILPINERIVLRDSVRAATGVTAAVYALAAVGLNLHFGYTGLLNFGHVGFMLAGAFGFAITVATFGAPFWFGIVTGIVTAAVLALVLGVPTLRLRADYLAIVTIAAAEILRFVTRSRVATDITGGPFGLTGFARPFFATNPVPEGTYTFWLIAYSERRVWMLIVAWGLVALATLMVYLLARSPWGRVLKAIRDDEDAARSLGKNVFSYKMQSLVIGGVIGGLAGILWVLHLQTAHPDSFLPIVTFFIFTLLVLGGPASTIGPVVGSVAFWFLLQGTDSLLRQARAGGLIDPALIGTQEIGAVRFALVGVMLLVLMIYRPQGMFGSKREMQLDA